VLHLFSGSIRYDNARVLAAQHDRRRFTPAFASVTPAGRLQEDAAADGCEAFALDAESRRAMPGAVARLVRELRRRRVHILQTHLFEATLVGALAGRLARVPLVIATAHHSRELQVLERRLPLLADTAASGLLAHRVIAPTAETARELVRRERVGEGDVAVVPHGFDLDRWRSSAEGRARGRARLGVEERELLVGAVGRLNWIKGHAALVRAFAEVARDDARLHLAIVGPGDAAPLRSLAAQLGVAERLVLPGLIEEVDDVYDAFDVFASTSIAESYGMAVVEAMAKERVVVATAVGVAPDVIEDGVSGFLVPPGDVPGLTAALRRAIETTAAAPDMGRAARAAVSHLTDDAMVRAYEALYDRWWDEVVSGRA